MSDFHDLHPDIRLHVEGRIAAEDAARQSRTAAEILRRLQVQPGVILADEVGMGKTFVALAVAVSVALANRGKRPVVVMVPPSLKEKWPADFEVFRERCLPAKLAGKVRCGRAERAVEFLKFLDDPPRRRKSVLFVTHGALSRGLLDRWVMLSIIYQAIKNRRGAQQLRNNVARFCGHLLNMVWAERNGADIWNELLTNHPAEWLAVLQRWGIDPERNGTPEKADDPVPRAVWKALPGLNTDGVYQALLDVPQRRSKNLDERLKRVREVLRKEIRALWVDCLDEVRLSLPLLVLDEAHHLKNPGTQLASLFNQPDALNDAEEISRGPLGGVFERMVFLTATPFQLGHGELCSVLDRFDGVSWRSRYAPKMAREGFEGERLTLRAALDAAQESAVTLDAAWGKLCPDDLVVDGTAYEDSAAWWEALRRRSGATPASQGVYRAFSETYQRMKKAEQLLQPWVIRHLKPRVLPEPNVETHRRQRWPGRAILLDADARVDEGLPVQGESLLPFLLAARATACAPASRPLFAEGLASSYEAFIETRRHKINGTAVLDSDDDGPSSAPVLDSARWYLDQLEALIPVREPVASIAHPKVGPTVDRVVDAWRQGEKVVVFCHYVATGKALRLHLSRAIRAEIKRLGAQNLGCSIEDVEERLVRIGDRFFDEDSPLRRGCDQVVDNILGEFTALQGYRTQLVDVIRRNLRTPSFLVRFFPLDRKDLNVDAVIDAMDRREKSGTSLRDILRDFFRFLVERCSVEDRRQYIDAVDRIQTGTHQGSDVALMYAQDELQGERPQQLLPNVRLVNGTTRADTRRRLMLTFNTPFYPEILIASSVLAEGVDLHLNCRHVIHHDLCWNPSTLEQRTGRIDRIGAKAERVGQPIQVYLPYVAETQDEKMYRVVMDRERWFNIVMGEDYTIDAQTAERLAARIPLPAAVAEALSFRLEVADPYAEESTDGGRDGRFP